ncbi:MAG: helix-turn-helix transcriptional regulator [Pseudorhodoplanes sp.]|nr:helix-turn-helix transcriptional regulator [Pseudorhodoplanes sp.]
MNRAISVWHGRFGRATIYEMDRPMIMHAHREGHLIFYVGGAPGWLAMPNGRYPIAPGFAVAVSPWEQHCFIPEDNALRASVMLILYINQDWFAQMGRGLHKALYFGRVPITVTPEIRAAVRHAEGIVLDGPAASSFDATLYHLTDLCFDQSWQSIGPVRPRAPGLQHIDFRVRKSLRLLSEQIGGDITLDAVARDAGLSRPHFYKLFRQQIGVTPNIYLNTLRMEKAVELLTGSDRSVTDIGFDLGFSSQSVFTRFFMANVGMAPTDYRRATKILHG